MKIAQAKNYKKPLYAIGLAATIMAASVSGCTDPGKGPDYAGGMDVRPTETTEVQLDGEVAESITETSETRLEGGVPIDDNYCKEA
ncbi:MAG: hypothetical protein E7386_08585 [Ruminococcaceae bacterium]|nr:hypothetical protein [Oscillospiraceae bacterium]